MSFDSFKTEFTAAGWHRTSYGTPVPACIQLSLNVLMESG
jgi:hypothetical protein